jgi:hypothetical protein
MVGVKNVRYVQVRYRYHFFKAIGFNCMFRFPAVHNGPMTRARAGGVYMYPVVFEVDELEAIIID